jgi:membrane protease YdiL (CAAX protease family)
MNIFGYPFVVALVVWVCLHFFYKEKLSDLFFSWKRFRWNAVWIGLIAAVLLSCFLQYAWEPFSNWLLPGKVDLSDFARLKHNPILYMIVLVLAVVVGGFYEEIIFHGFIFTRFEKMFRFKYAPAFNFILSNIVFGAYHYQQGVKGMLVAGIAGCVYLGLTLRFGRNMWYGLFVHSFFDFIGLTIIFLGY